MKINRLGCEQFAGVRDRLVQFEPGLNILLGANEAGKSTLLDLLYHLLFQEITIDGRAQKEGSFADVFFPKSTGKYAAEVIDGTVEFETENGKYKLYKEWVGKKGALKLTLPDGNIIKSESTINEILSKELIYGKGIYKELVFPTQKGNQTFLSSLFGNVSKKDFSESINELTALVTKAVLETGGIAIDKLENELKYIIDDYEGQWDVEANTPKGGRTRGIQNKWKNGVGRILEAYYDMEDAKRDMEQAKSNEEVIEDLEKQIREKETEQTRLDLEKDEFRDASKILNDRKLLNLLEEDYQKMEGVLEAWPALETNIEKAQNLKTKLEQAAIRKKYCLVKGLKEQEESFLNNIDKLGTIEKEDIELAETLQAKTRTLEAKLTGMNVVAHIKRLGANEVHVVSNVTGAEVELSSESIDITESVNVTIPGVVEIALMSKGLDLDEVLRVLEQARSELNAILLKYSANSVKDLNEKFKELDKSVSELHFLQGNINNQLNGITWTELMDKSVEIPKDLPQDDLLQEEAKSLFGEGSIDHYLGSNESVAHGYRETYISPTELIKSIDEKDEDIRKTRSALVGKLQLLEKYQDVVDLDAYINSLNSQKEEAKNNITKLRGLLREAEKKIDDKSSEDCESEYQKKEEEYKETLVTYRRWKHIWIVFQELKDKMKSKPFLTIEANFKKYLDELTQGGITLQEVSDKLETKMVSGSHPLTYHILSEGTKDTIALAFRLAVLEHLFPNGQGIAVFDDPFTDMDPMRTQQACRLIQMFAQRNQVIFVTCDDKYTKLLDGHLIQM